MISPRIVEKVLILKPIKPNFYNGRVYTVDKLEEYFKPKYITYLIVNKYIRKLE